MYKMKPARVVMFGTAGIADVAHFYFQHDSPYEVVAFTADARFIDKDSFHGLPVVPFETVEKEYPPSDYALFVALSYKNLNKFRAGKCAEAKQKGYRLVSYVSAKSAVWTDKIGDNCLILENQVIQPFVEIGNDVTLWSGNHVGHHSIIDDHCFVASHVVISGNVHVHPYCFIGVNATLRDGIRIGAECVIGAAAVILGDTGEGQVYGGRATKPARVSSSELPRI